MFTDELEQAFAACPLVYFAYGLCEPHGPQNAVGLDALKAHAQACAAARADGGIVAPPEYRHVHELGRYAAWSERAVGQEHRSWLTCTPPWQHFNHCCARPAPGSAPFGRRLRSQTRRSEWAACFHPRARARSPGPCRRHTRHR